MCGIAGLHRPGGLRPGDRAVVEEMLDRQRHRGPDGQGIHRIGTTILGHRRLAIVDPEGGDQPLVGSEGALVCNGEIYNHRRLPDPGLPTHSDAARALGVLEEDGREGLGRLRGMFALAHADRRGRLTLARDPVGIKPLSVGRLPDGAVVFASEQRALPRHIEEAEVVAPGTWTDGRGTSGRLGDLPRPEVEEGIDPQKAARSVRRALKRAVERRLMGDVPVGALLSGGLDSSAVVALAAARKPDLRTFAVGLEGSPDLAQAARVARHLGTDHHQEVLRPEEVERAVRTTIAALESFDPSLVRSAVPTVAVARLASRHVKVVLSGEGADELFAGYAFLAERHPDRLHRDLWAMIDQLHEVNLQRADRLSMAHGLEVRVPFLDLEVIETAMAVPSVLKRRDGVAKWVLREAVAALLPVEVVRRPKAQFADGTGVTGVLREAARRRVDPARVAELAGRFPSLGIRTQEAAWYLEEFLRLHPNLDPEAVGRWVGERPAPAVV